MKKIIVSLLFALLIPITTSAASFYDLKVGAGGLTATSATSTLVSVHTGTITSPGAVTITAGGVNKNVTLMPSGNGYTLLNGNVGIGDTSPGNKLDVHSTGNTRVLIHSNDSLNDRYPALELRAGNVDSGAYSIIEFSKTAGSENLESLQFQRDDGTPIMTLNGRGNVGIGTTNPTAIMHLKAGTATAYTGPLKFTVPGAVLLGTPEVGVLEPLNDDLFYTITTGTARKGIIFDDGTNLTSGRVSVATTNGRLTDFAGFTYADSVLTAPTFSSTSYSISGHTQGTEGGMATLGAGGLLAQNAPSGFTINGQTAWHAGNDGSGSGLDADTVATYAAPALLARANHTGTQSISTLSDLPTLASGTYLPTAGPLTNLDSSPTILTAQYMRVGSVVTVSGMVQVNPTTTATLTAFRLSLPIASNFSTSYQANGVASDGGVESAALFSDNVNDEIAFKWITTGTSLIEFCYTYTYLIL